VPDIRHRVGIAAPRHRVYEALATNGGLTDFWTAHVEGDSEVDGRLSFFFTSPNPAAVMEVVELSPDDRVQWRCVEGPPEWVGTTVTLRSERQRRRDRGAVHACRLAGTGRVHASLQHQVGHIPDRPEKRPRRRRFHRLPQRHEGQQQLALTHQATEPRAGRTGPSTPRLILIRRGLVSGAPMPLTDVRQPIGCISNEEGIER
jgi:uncharacterized protein YndB with AHSA1/START domain